MTRTAKLHLHRSHGCHILRISQSLRFKEAKRLVLHLVLLGMRKFFFTMITVCNNQNVTADHAQVSHNKTTGYSDELANDDLFP